MHDETLSRVYDTLSPLHYGCKILGLCPYKRTKDGYRVSWMGVACTVCAMLFHLSNGFVLTASYFNEWPNVILLITAKLKVYATFISTANIYLREILNQGTFINLAEGFGQVDLVLRKYGVESHGVSAKKKIFAAVILNYFLGLASIILDLVTYWKTPFDIHFIQFSLLFIVPNVVHFTVCCITCTYMFMIRQRFSIINRRILTGLLSGRTTGCHGKCVIKDMEKIHDKLCFMLEQIVSKYSFTILFIIFIGYCGLFSQLHTWFSALINDYTQFFEPLTLAHTFFAFIYMFLPIVVIIVSCEDCVTEGKQTAISMLRIAPATDNPSVIASVRSSVWRIGHKPRDIYASGLFVVNRKLLATIIGSGMTLFVILIQFDMATSFSKH